MEIVDTTTLTVVFGAVGLALLAGLVVLALALATALPVTRRERLARGESIPTYYGRLHFTG